METSAYTPLAGALSGTLNGDSAVAGQIPGNRRRRQEGDADNFDFSIIGVDKFFWSEKFPFEAILKPLEYISDQSGGGSGIPDVLIIHQIPKVQYVCTFGGARPPDPLR